MTVPASSSRRVTYTANGSTAGPFAVTFPFFEIEVYLDEVLVSPNDYLVSQASPGTTGNITFDTAPTGALVIIGATNRAQGIDFISQDTVQPDEAERGLDRLTMIAQEIETALKGSLRVDVGVSTVPGPIDLGLVANKLVVTKSDGGIKTVQANAGYVQVDAEGTVATVQIVGAGELGTVLHEAVDGTISDRVTTELVVPIGGEGGAASTAYVDAAIADMVDGPVSSLNYEAAHFNGTSGKLLRAGGPIILTPRMFGATGTGTETAALTALFAAHEATVGSEIRIDRPYTLDAPIYYSADGLRLHFSGDGELIVTGSAAMYGAVNCGTFPSTLTGRSLTVDAARHATSLTFNNVTGMDVGHILRLNFLGIIGVNQSFCAKIVAKSGSTVYLSHPLPWPLTTATVFTDVTSGSARNSAVVENFKLRVSGHSGVNMAGLRFVNCEGARLYGSRTEGCISGGILIGGCVDSQFYDHTGINDGSLTSDAALPVYGMTGCLLDNCNVLGSEYFGFQIDYVHHSKLRSIKGRNIGIPSSYSRGFKMWDVSNTTVDGLEMSNVYGQGVSMQNNCQDVTFRDVRVIGVKQGTVLGSPFAAQGVTSNGTSNLRTRWYGLTVKDTQSGLGGTDVAFGSTDNGHIVYGGDFATITDGTTGAVIHMIDGSVTARGHYVTPPQTLTDGANISWDAALGNKAKVTLGGNRTVLAVSNAIEGAQYTLTVVQDGTGSRTLTWTTSGAGSFDFGASGAPTLTTTASRADVLRFEAVSVAGTIKLRYQGANLGFA